MRLHKSERGAAMVFGLFFAIFMVAVVYAIHGTIETLVYREHVQDAADAAAFSAAVVNARGMNLIVLLNMLMAALMSILVGLRIGQTVCYIGIAICVALSFPTMGSSMAYTPLFQSWAKTFNTAFNRLKDPIHNAIGVLHKAGKATSVAVPIGANLRVIDLIASRYDAVGLAIPSRLTLPVEDDEPSVLCSHAAELAGYIVMLPLSPLLPDRIEDALAEGLGSLAEAGSDWFCGVPGARKPDLNSTESKRAGFERLPHLPSQKACDDAEVGEPGSAAAAEKERLCKFAAYESLISQPGRDGMLRKGERPCPTDCNDNPRASCPPEEFMDCTAEEAERVDAVAREHQGERIQNTYDNPYSRRLQAAKQQCKPSADGGSEQNLSGYEWLQHEVTRTHVFNRQAKAWQVDSTTYGETVYVRNDPDDKSYPCGRDFPENARKPAGGTIGKTYEVDNTRFLCEGKFECLEDTLYPGQVPDKCGRPLIPPSGYTRFREKSVEVIALVACSKPVPAQTYQVPSTDLNKEMEEAGETENGSAAVSFRLEKDLYLGGSDFQLRSAVFAIKGPSNETEKSVAAGSRGHEARNQTPQTLVDAANVGARLGLAQAEYYFDWSNIDGAEEREEWMWNMGWRARLRPFRINHSKADAPRETDERGFDDEQLELGGEGLTDGPSDRPECGETTDCAGVQSGFDLVSGWEAP